MSYAVFDKTLSNIAFTFNVGIGTTVALAPLHVQGNQYVAGNLGIGTTEPLTPFHLNAVGYVSGAVGVGSTMPISPLDVNVSSSSNAVRIRQSGAADALLVSTVASANALRVMNDGKVGVGTATALTTHHVQGTSYTSGNLGIGTTIPTERLHVFDGSAEAAVMVQSGTGVSRGELHMMSSTADSRVAVGYLNRPLYIGRTDGTSAGTQATMVFTTSDNVGVGTTDPQEKLHVVGNVLASGTVTASNLNIIGRITSVTTTTSNAQQMVINNAGTGPALKVVQSGANTVAEFTDAESGTVMFMANGGNIGVGTSSPSGKFEIIDENNTIFYLTEYSTSDGAVIRARRARGTLASPTAVQTDDVLTGLRGFGHNGTSFGSISGYVDIKAAETHTATAQGSYISFVTTPNTTTTPAERVRITHDGNVGIGVASISEKLAVEGNILIRGANTETRYMEIGIGRTGNGASYLDFVGDATYSDYGLRVIRNAAGANATSAIQHRGTGSLQITTQEAAAVVVSTTNTERMRIASDGNVGVGTATVGYAMSVVTKGSGTGLEIQARSGATDGAYLRLSAGPQSGIAYLVGSTASGNASGASNFEVYDTNANSSRLVINQSGNVGVGTVTPLSLMHLNSGAFTFTNASVRNVTATSFNVGVDGWYKIGTFTHTSAGEDCLITISGGVGYDEYTTTTFLSLDHQSIAYIHLRGANGGAVTNSINISGSFWKHGQGTYGGGSGRNFFIQEVKVNTAGNRATSTSWDVYIRTGVFCGYLQMKAETSSSTGCSFTFNPSVNSSTKTFTSPGGTTFDIPSSFALSSASNLGLFMDSVGEIGIGTASPSSSLHVDSSTDQFFATPKYHNRPVMRVSSTDLTPYDASGTYGSLTTTGTVMGSTLSPVSSSLGLYSLEGSVFFNSGYLTFAAGTGVAPTNIYATDFTMEAWVYNTTTPGNPGGKQGYLIGDMGPTSGTNNWSFGVNSDGKITWYASFVGNAGLVLGGTVPNNTWTHIAVKYVAGATKQMQLFINGTAQTLSTYTWSGTFAVTVNTVQTPTVASFTATTPTQTTPSAGVTVGQNNNVTHAFYVSNLRVLIGTAQDPTTSLPLSIVGSTTKLLLMAQSFQNNFTVLQNGYVGIGLTNPSVPLEIQWGVAKLAQGMILDTRNSTGYLSMVAYGNNNYIQSGLTSTGNSAAPLIFSTINAATEWARFNSSGNLGINVTNPADKLEVSGNIRMRYGNKFIIPDGANVATYVAAGSAGNGCFIWNDSQTLRLETLNSGDGKIAMRIGTADRMTIGTDGNVGIGTTSPLTSLHVNNGRSIIVNNAPNSTWYGNNGQRMLNIYSTSAGSGGGILLDKDNTAASDVHLLMRTSSAPGTGYNFINCQVYGQAAQGFQNVNAGQSIVSSFIVYGNGNVQNTNNSYGAISDVTLKENIVDARDYTDDLMRLRVVKFSFKNARSDVPTHLGLIAQEVEEVFPSIIEESRDQDTNTTHKGIKYSIINMMLLKSFQELNKKYEALQQQHQILSDRIAAIEAKV